MHNPSAESLPWDEQKPLDDAPYRRQVQYLFDNSLFYRKKLQEAGFKDAASVGGINDIGQLPFTEKDELRASRSDENPIGTHLAVPLERLTRIFSTSGTTGT